MNFKSLSPNTKQNKISVSDIMRVQSAVAESVRTKCLPLNSKPQSIFFI